MKLKRMIAILLAGMLAAALFSACSGTAEETGTDTDLPKTGCTCVTLGDSIAAGFGLERPADGRFSALLCEDLSQSGQKTWADRNFGMSGDDTSDLLRRLGNEGFAKGLTDADLVVVCIGANNILQVYTPFLVRYLTLGGDELVSDFQQFNADAQAGIDRYTEDMTGIVSAIRKANPDAPVVLLTVYNPYADSDASLRIGGVNWKVATLADSLVRRLNERILQCAEKNGFLVADVYAAFASQKTAPVNGTYDASNPLLFDPHPNKEGHELIAAILTELPLQAAEDD
ncbi:MAG: SGNH/GDSL hydrolase family protein [Clostridia bacterium]|nr:SGNH/GDSL hydrolase family protein [Clostridia bacterium]